MMLTQTRYAAHFRVKWDLSMHYGLFDCGAKKAIGSLENNCLNERSLSQEYC